MEISLSDGEASRRFEADLKPESVTTGVKTVLLTVPVRSVDRGFDAPRPPRRPIRATVALSVDELLTVIEYAPSWALAALRQRLAERY